MPNYYIKTWQKIAFIFGWLLFGNLADNAFDPKPYLVLCSLGIGVAYILMGLFMDFLSPASMTLFIHYLQQSKDAIMVLYAGTYAISMV